MTNNNKAPPAPPPLPLSQTENGALATAPLSTVVNAATNALYQDLYDLVHGEIKIVSVVGAGAGHAPGGGSASNNANGAPSDAAHSPNTHAAASVEEKLTAAALGTEANGPNPSGTTPTYNNAGTNAASTAQDNVFETRKERMANLSFAQRRHELSKRLVRNAKSLSHVYALAAASLPKSHSALQNQMQRQHGHHRHASPRDHPPPRLGASVQASSDALRFAKAGWVAQDEAQDALYFHHDGLWKARAHCHDVLGALCVLSTPFPGEAGGGAAREMQVDGDSNEAEAAEETTRENEATNSFKRRRLDSDAAIRGGGGRWPDFPTDVALAVDRYEISREKSHSPRELKARLACAVRRKLVSGEVGRCGAAGDRGGDVLPWKVVLEKGGGSVRLTYGTPKRVSTAEALRQRSLKDVDETDARRNRDVDRDRALRQYPMEARLSVLSEHPDAPWKLLSVHVRCAPKTGESDHQLGMNRKQMFDLHRIGERAMIVEEAIWKKRRERLAVEAMKGNAREDAKKEKEEEKKSEEGNDGGADNDEHTVTVDTGEHGNINPSSTPSVPRPLHRLFEVTHSFALSLQLEMLSSQAEALRRGAWGGAASAIRPTSGAGAEEATGDGIAVSPAFFFDGSGVDGIASGAIPTIAVMAVHFWSCDDRYGSPKVGDLSSGIETGEAKEGAALATPTSRSKLAQRTDDNYLPKSDRRGEKRLSLCIRAVPMVGLVVSLSGGSEVAASLSAKSDPSSLPKHSHHVQRNVDKLLSSIQDPFQLSMSDALLAATVLCAEKRCHAVVAALNNQKTNRLPTWIHLDVECGSISVAASISYFSNSPAESNPPCILFRLACDSRSGRFVPSFPRSTTLLRLLACSDGSASDIQSLRTAAMTSALRSGSVGRKGAGGRIDGATREFTGRIVRDAFDALSRAVDTLGRRCGVGGDWNDIDAQSASLRERSVVQACRDVRLSLMTCSGIAAVFGMAAIGLKVASGADPVADGAGGPIDDSNNPGTIQIPPLSVHLRQRIVEKVVNEGGDETKRISILEGELLAVTAKMSDENLELICYDVLTATESAQSVPMRLKFMPAIPPKASISTDVFNNENRLPKRHRTEHNGRTKSHHTLDEVEKAALWFESILNEP